MALRPWMPILLGLTILAACGSREEAGQGRDQARIDALDRRLGTLEQRLSTIEKDIPGGEPLRDEVHALEQRLGAAEAKATQALETAKTAPPAAPGASGPGARGMAALRPAPFDPVERREQLNALTLEYRRKLAALPMQDGAQAGPAERMAARRQLRDWYIAHRRAILSGRPLAD
jgi:hypothetical protein